MKQLKAWHMIQDGEIVSQFDRNYANDVDPQMLKVVVGVEYYNINVDDLNNDDSFKLLKKQMGITFQDSIEISPQKFPNYEDKIFFAEHLHADDEIRLVLDGSGYFDIRDENDNWIRMHTQKGDLITLPAGAYHRFTNDEHHYIHAMRLFVGDPVWTPINRPADDHISRFEYIKKHSLFATKSS